MKMKEIGPRGGGHTSLISCTVQILWLSLINLLVKVSSCARKEGCAVKREGALFTAFTVYGIKRWLQVVISGVLNLKDFGM